MLLKERTESEELLILRYLHRRMELSKNEKRHYFNLEKGFEGEKKFDSLLDDLQEERYIINDLLLEVHNSYFQIDTLIISQSTIYLIDIKNYEGDFYLNSDKLYSVISDNEYKNPIDQLRRCTTLLRQLLQTIDQPFPIESYLIFINPEFTLYQAQVDSPIIFPTQITRFLKELNHPRSRLNEKHKKLAETLLSLHHNKNPFLTLPKFQFEQLQKGIYCSYCHSFLISLYHRHLECKNCGQKEKLESAILRQTHEYILLFPDKKLTTHNIYDWCKADINKRTIRRVLAKYFTRHRKTNGVYYK
ncbi:NERD domain-containing protein [Robertmurraya sp. DFI.2.37]|uniref:NERD domain-containing protein n=1 Tax=Robertmurraya sp. DFI.2.37 TaxID=3031819 RepID=UPI0017845BDF|nr:NERD domain-containing protein [Robertmurraya sp. DFI.2.37]MDF1507301.1 NERD domain-containing protein [Robertmurraya sp. DFI.2.37]